MMQSQDTNNEGVKQHPSHNLREVILEDVNKLSNGIQNKVEEESNILRDTLEALLIDPLEQLEPPKVAWEQVDPDGKQESMILGTLGNFSLVIGKAKSRKSFFMNIALSATVGDDIVLERFKGCLPDDKRQVLYFDTEQGKYHVQLALKRVCRQLGVSVPENLKVYGLRTKKPSERLKLIEYAIYNTPGLGFVVIDGIKDLVTSINDEAEATMIASKLLQWTEERGIHIVVVLHQNKGDNNARGHIGTELINKAETVLSVTKSDQDNNISIVNPEMCRNREPEPFAFEIIEGLPRLVDNFQIRTSESNKLDVSKMEEFKIYQLLTEVFSHGDEFGYADLTTQIKLAFKKQFKRSIGNNKIRDLITMAKNNNWIIQEKSRSPYTLGQYKDIDGDMS